MTGPNALYWRQLTLENDEDEVKKEFNETMRSLSSRRRAGGL